MSLVFLAPAGLAGINPAGVSSGATVGPELPVFTTRTTVLNPAWLLLAGVLIWFALKDS